jgi:hypothetical protein
MDYNTLLTLALSMATISDFFRTCPVLYNVLTEIEEPGCN